jgi:rfaE bifunctional protein nucleotidyltransferase chain/domain
VTVTVFTNGCFDLLHPGHIHLLERARSLGDRLVVGLNGDRSVRELKGPGRPILAAEARRRMLASLRCVDEVIVFEEPTPERLIAELGPDVLVKGSDWELDRIAGRELVEGAGGRVVRIGLLEGWSTSDMVTAMGGGPDGLPSAPETDLPSGQADAVAAHIALVSETIARCGQAIATAGSVLATAARQGSTVFACGNGGSAAQAQHLAAELVGGTGGRHRSIRAQALTADGAVLTALANDRGYERVFADQVERLADSGDVVVGISAGGGSQNVIDALAAGRDRGCATIALTSAGSPVAAEGGIAIGVPGREVGRVQEVHDLVIHLWCDQLARECPR